ncbi:hypothetical protein ACHIPZ_23865 [Antrihabitans sp. NCIMB 15449]|uniref:Prevent-host-death protein n=1 Tax=Antrihabitans spumae TaxID=3373370 RepID=A0ABW7JVQ6_9NOCA
MYFEEFVSAGNLTTETAEKLAAVAGRYSSRLTITSNGRSVHAPVLPVCWDVLRVQAGSSIAVTAEAGRCPPVDEDELALRDFVTSFQQLTAGHR